MNKPKAVHIRTGRELRERVLVIETHRAELDDEIHAELAKDMASHVDFDVDGNILICTHKAVERCEAHMAYLRACWWDEYETVIKAADRMFPGYRFNRHITESDKTDFARMGIAL